MFHREGRKLALDTPWSLSAGATAVASDSGCVGGSIRRPVDRARGLRQAAFLRLTVFEILLRPVSTRAAFVNALDRILSLDLAAESAASSPLRILSAAIAI